MENLPPGVVEENGLLFRYVEKVSADGKPWKSRRPVALTIEDARKFRFDYFHPTRRGWILEGYKWEKDRTPDDIMSDVSTSIPAEPPEPDAMRTASPPEIKVE